MQIATQYQFCVAVFAMHFFQLNSGPAEYEILTDSKRQKTPEGATPPRAVANLEAEALHV